MKNKDEIKRIETEISELKFDLSIEFSIRMELLECINRVYQADEFDVADAHRAIDSISNLKTNALTLLTKKIYNLQTYKNQLLVEDMREIQKQEDERFKDR